MHRPLLESPHMASTEVGGKAVAVCVVGQVGRWGEVWVAVDSGARAVKSKPGSTFLRSRVCAHLHVRGFVGVRAQGDLILCPCSGILR